MTDSVDLVVEGKSSKTDKHKRYSGALMWKNKEAKDKPLNNYQGAVLRFERLKGRLAYTCILFLATVFCMIDSVETVMEGKSSKTDENKRRSGALPWKDKEAKSKPVNNFQCAVYRFEHLKRRLAYRPTCILFLASVFSVIDSVETVRESISSKTDKNKCHSGALSWKDKKARNKPFNNYQCGVLWFEH